jgi:glycosyltransferase involved in cell wall biosynthesis
MPKLSIITVNLNNKAGLADTAQSVVAQTWIDYEWLIIDGGSTDGSVEVIKEYADKTDKLVYWCSEPDGGIYQGMNKGIEKASGEYCWFLNSGDYAYKNTTLAEIFANKFDEDIVYGDICIKYPGVLCLPNKVVRTNKRNVHSPANWVDCPAIYHQASFIKSDLFTKQGGYKTIFKLANDTEFAMNAIFNNYATTKYINSVFAVFDTCGIGSSINNESIKKTVLQEHGNIIVNMFPYSYMRIYAGVIFRSNLKKIFLPFFWCKNFVLRTQYIGIKMSVIYYMNKLFNRRENV